MNNAEKQIFRLKLKCWSLTKHLSVWFVWFLESLQLLVSSDNVDNLTTVDWKDQMLAISQLNDTDIILYYFVLYFLYADSIPSGSVKGLCYTYVNVCLNACYKMNVNNGQFSLATLKPSYLLILEHWHLFLMHTKLSKTVTGIGLSHPVIHLMLINF